jgi:opacity protein-like surface antigen
MRTRTAALLAGLALAAAPAAARAQYEPSTREPTPWYVGGSLSYARPQGEFRQNVKQGFGGDLHAIYRLDQAGIVGLRMDGAFLVYGDEHETVPLSSTIGGRVDVDLNTTNNIAFVGIGPQVGVPTGRLRPYANGYVGMSYLFTESSVKGTSSGETFASTTNYHDATFSWGGGAGLYVPLSRSSVSPVSLDLGLRYQNNGRARYLRRGDITDNPDNTITVHPRHSDTDLLTFQVGVSVGISR